MTIEQPLSDEELPLHGITVLDFSQFLAGPVAAMRLADLGARVIKVERPGYGDAARGLAFAGRMIDGTSLSFHAMNRNKEGITADLKDPDDLARVRDLVAGADVLVQNFRPGVMERIGLDWASARELNPRLIYASVSGYGDAGPWAARPGQDLLAQAVSGLPWLSGSREDPPVPVGLAIADHLASCHLAQGVMALLVRRGRTGEGGLVQTSLLEAMLDLQFELLTTRLNDPSLVVRRGGERSAHSFLGAPYGIYPTSDGFLAIAMNPVPVVGALLQIPELVAMTEPSSWWERQEEVEMLLSDRLRTRTRDEWLAVLDEADVWCAPVLTLDELLEHPGFAALGMTQEVVATTEGSEPLRLSTTRSPLRVDGRRLLSERGAPALGEHDVPARVPKGDPV